MSSATWPFFCRDPTGHLTPLSRTKSSDKLFKVIFVGDSGVGKTCLITRLFSDKFDEHCPATIGCDFKLKDLEYEGRKVRLSLWDTAGQERFQAITSTYYRGADAVVYVYDVTQRHTFEALRDNWMPQFHQYTTKPHAVQLVLANKTDLVERREVSGEEGATLAKDCDCLYRETSARKDVGVYDAIMWGLVYTLLEGPEEEGPAAIGEPSIHIMAADNCNASSSCC